MDITDFKSAIAVIIFLSIMMAYYATSMVLAKMDIGSIESMFTFETNKKIQQVYNIKW